MGLLEKIRNFFVLEEEDFPIEPEEKKPNWKGKLINLNSTRHNATIRILEPSSLAEAQEIGDYLKNKAAVLIKVQGLEPQLATRILDFISGMTYALSGTTQKISENIFLFAPSSFSLIAEPKKTAYSEDSMAQFLNKS